MIVNFRIRKISRGTYTNPDSHIKNNNNNNNNNNNTWAVICKIYLFKILYILMMNWLIFSIKIKLAFYTEVHVHFPSLINFYSL
jgi:hypothetical protein